METVKEWHCTPLSFTSCKCYSASNFDVDLAGRKVEALWEHTVFNEQSLLCKGDISISNPVQYHSSSKALCSEDGTKSIYLSQ